MNTATIFEDNPLLLDSSVMETTGSSVRIKRRSTEYRSLSDFKKVNLTLRLIEQDDQNANSMFEAVMNKHHYLGMAKHHAAEIRYLVYHNQQWVAVISFGSSAWQCAARDAWIGWDDQSRINNLQKIVNNTRFLVNPKLSGGNFASQVLSLVSKKVRADWKARYGKEIVLMETFVDERFDGAGYKASNWIYVGKTQGRGKWDSQHHQAESIKKIYLYPLVTNATTQLGGNTTKKTKDWVEQEFETFAPKDERISKRLQTVTRDFYANPNASIPQACNSRAKTKATYRFFEHKDVTITSVLNAHYQSTKQRLAGQKIVLAVQDSTSLNYSTHNNPELGTLSVSTKKEGIMVHDTMAFTEDGVPLGLLDVQTWERDPADYGKRSNRAEKPIEEKESYKWLKSYQALIPIQKTLKRTTLISVGDREADLYELFDLAQRTEQAPEILVRAKHNRKLTFEEKKLWESLGSEPISGTLTIEVPRKPGQKKRTATLSVSYKAITINGSTRKQTATIWAVYVREENPPEKIAPISWMLLTTIAVESLQDATEKVSWYVIRWQIEVYHKIIKSGCRIEERQLETLASLKACIALDLVVAWKIFQLTKLSRRESNLPCTICLEDHEWKALCCFHKKDKNPPKTPPSLREAVKMIAELGGFLGRKSDGDPGPITIWRGWIVLSIVVQCMKWMNSAP